MQEDYGICPMGDCKTPLTQEQELSVCNECLPKYSHAEIAKILKDNTVKTLNEHHLNRDNLKSEEEKQFIEEIRETEGYDDKERIGLIIQHKYKIYADNTNPNLPVYYWDGKTWNKDIEPIILREMSNFFGLKKAKVRKEELMDYFRGDGQNTQVIPKPPTLIPLLNGLYDLDKKKLIPHTPKYFYVNIIPHNYNKDAKATKWLKFEKDIHQPEYLQFMQEWFGYGLYTGYPKKSFVICVGKGDNGKSIELGIIKNIIGHKNNTSVSLQHINDSPYGIAELQHKLTNISDDISNTVIKATGNLKVVSDGGEITARRIYGHPFDMTPYAKITNSCNQPPEIFDDSPAIWNRLKSVEYKYEFVEKPITESEKQSINRDKLIGSLEKEYEGIINWLLEGLLRLKKNKFVFSYPHAPKQVRIAYIARSNPIIAWANDQLIATDENDFLIKQEIYKPFKNWCLSKDVASIPSETMFFKKLKNAGYEEYRPPYSEDDRRTRYIGLKLRETRYINGEKTID